MISPDQVELSTRDITVFPYIPLTDNSLMKNVVASRTIPTGSIIHEKTIIQKPAITSGDIVFVEAGKGSVKVSVQTRAREKGAIGDKIWVENSITHQIFQVEVTGPGTAAISSKGVL